MAENNEGKFRDKMRQIIARSWTDPEYKAKLVSDPKTVFADAGLPVPDNKQIRVIEDTQDAAHFILPAPNEQGVLSDEQLDQLGFFDEFAMQHPVPWTGCCSLTGVAMGFPEDDS